MAAVPPPDLYIPDSSSTVHVSVIDTTTTIKGIDTWKFMSPSIPGHDYLAAPAFAFLIQHPTLDRSLVFDLGVRKDWWNCSPFLRDRFRDSAYTINVEKSVREILNNGGIDTAKLEAVVWSHWHFDHTGDPSEFEKSTALIVGPGFKKNVLPGYPTNPHSSVSESDYEGRELIELQMGSDLKIGEMEAVDYFGDGSLYFLNSPGHAHGHICALARVTAQPASFILMGGDAYHHAGELRPSPYLPLPGEIRPHPCEYLGAS
jgi:glyoxylase-like metal-dependent hydrolase (beta-lactamase superfamily II)